MGGDEDESGTNWPGFSDAIRRRRVGGKPSVDFLSGRERETLFMII